MSQLAHQPALDGWRGLAIVLLLVGHFSPVGGINLGSVGVNLFFVLSGLLMGQLLFIKQVPLRQFYQRRIARIVPAHLCFIAAVVATWLALGKPVSWTETASAAAFLNNYLTGDLKANLMPFGHIWSLAVEEHSYLLLSLLALLAGVGRRRALPGLLLCLTASLAITIWYWRQDSGTQFTFGKALHTEVSAFGIFVSAAISVAIRRFGMPTAPGALVIGLLLLGICMFWWSVPFPLRQLIGVSSMALAVNLLPFSRGWAQALLSLAPLRQFGLWSFSLYLWQQPFYLAYHHGGIALPQALAAALACGLASYYLVEGPARAFLNARWGRPPAPRANAQPTTP